MVPLPGAASRGGRSPGEVNERVVVEMINPGGPLRTHRIVAS